MDIDVIRADPEKIRDMLIKRNKTTERLDRLLEADGGVSLSNLPDLKEAGLDVAVMGTAMYRSADPAADIRAIRQL